MSVLEKVQQPTNIVEEEPIPLRSVKTLVLKSLKRTHDMFLSNFNLEMPHNDDGYQIKVKSKLESEYSNVIDFPVECDTKPEIKSEKSLVETRKPSELIDIELKGIPLKKEEKKTQVEFESNPQFLKVIESFKPLEITKFEDKTTPLLQSSQEVFQRPRVPFTPKPQFHPHWKLYRVISGHLGWVRCVAVEPQNQWFCTGSNDRTIKIWDLASGILKLSLTGHISHIRSVAISNRHPYLFSAGEDKQVKCWDLECNKVVRHYHGHLLAVYDLSIHPTLDVLVTASRDATCRVWDMRTKACAHVLTGHTEGVLKVKTQPVSPQVITGSMDTTVKLWDLGMGRVITTLTNHKKSVRALELHHSEFTFVSASADNMKKWKFPDGDFLLNCDKNYTIVNGLSTNQDNVLAAGSDNGFLHFYDYKTGYNFQKFRTPPQSGSLESEAGIYALSFDNSGSRLITCEADKTIKMYKEDENSTEESNPVLWKPQLKRPKF